MSNIKKWMIKAWDHKLTLFVYLASIYLIFYTIYFFNKDLKKYIDVRGFEDLIKYLSQVSILIFTSGIFAASLKYLQLLQVFKNQFNEYIESSKFDSKLKKNLKLITFSDEYLLEQTNLPTLWKKITLCMYKKEFPEIHEKVSSKLRNKLFEKNNISYYYKDFHLTYEIELLEDGYVRTIQRGSYTLVRPNEEKFKLDFGLNCSSNEERKKDFKLYANLQGEDNFLLESDIITTNTNGNCYMKAYKEFEGSKEYNIERKTITYQKLKDDRIFSFSTNRIIDGINIDIKHSENMNVIFHPVNNERFNQNNISIGYNQSYISKEILLPDEKYVLIFLRNK